MSRNTRVLLIAVVALLAVGGYWKLALKPKRAEAATLAHEVATQKAQLAQQQTLLASYQGKQAAYKTNFAKVTHARRVAGKNMAFEVKRTLEAGRPVGTAPQG